MPASTPNSLINLAEGVVVATLLSAYGLVLLVRLLRRSRPDYHPGVPLAVGLGLRLLATAAISVSGLQATLQGGDELGFVATARQIATAPLASGVWAPGRAYPLHEIVLALQIKLGDLGVGALRVTQVTIAVSGLLLLATAVHDLAGPRSARLALWLMALEPASIFFSQLLHKESLMVLATGLVALGGSRVWRAVDPLGLVLLASGSAVGILTRPYAGWFLASAGVLIVLHATVRDASRSLSALAVLACALVGIGAAVPVIVQVSSKQNLQATLQVSQDAHAREITTSGTSSNLTLEHVDYSTRAAIITNLPVRIRDLLLRPYPWQLANTSERLGVFGTVVAYAMLGALLFYGVSGRRELVRLGGPLLYPLGFLTVAYALSVGNAGTGFRYRSHLMMLGLAILAVLREYSVARQVEPLSPAARRVGRRAAIGFDGRATVTRGRPKRLA